MSTLAARRANLFKGTRVEGLQREPGNQSLEIEALSAISVEGAA